MDVMSKKFRGKVNNSSSSGSRSCGNMAAESSDADLRWPSIAGPSVPENNPKLWKTPRLDMSSSLSFLRRELAAMQIQDRGLHKQLLALNSAIRDLKTALNEPWEDTQSLNQFPEDEIDGEILVSSYTQVCHTKQDSGILTDEETDAECDTFEAQEVVRPFRGRSKSTTSICYWGNYIGSGYNDTELDVIQSAKKSPKDHVIKIRPRSYTEGEALVRPLRSRSKSAAAIFVSGSSSELDINENVPQTSINGHVITTRPRFHSEGEAQDVVRPFRGRSKSAAGIVFSGSSPELDINQNVKTSINGHVITTRPRSHTEGDEERDVFEAQDIVRPFLSRSKSAAAIFNPELDINQNVKTNIKGHVITPRPKLHTLGEFHRVTSMPVINEIPGNMNSIFSGKAFAVSGYQNTPRSPSTYETRTPFPGNLSRHGSMPVISNIGRTNVRHARSETVPIDRGIHKNFSSTSQVNRTDKKPLYRIWRSSSQISLV